VKTCLRIFNFILLLFLLISCSTHHELRLKGAEIRKKTDPALNRFILKDDQNKRKRYTLKRYLLESESLASAKLNSKGILEIKSGNFLEADILLKTAEKYSPKDYAVKNNLAVLSELRGKDNEGFKYYMEAAQLKSDNKYIMQNFIRFKYKPGRIEMYLE